MSSSAGKDTFNYLIYFSNMFCMIRFWSSYKDIFYTWFSYKDSLKTELFEQKCDHVCLWTHFLAEHHVADLLNYDLKCTRWTKLFFFFLISLDLFPIVLRQKTRMFPQSFIVTKHCNSGKCFVVTVNFAQILPFVFFTTVFVRPFRVAFVKSGNVISCSIIFFMRAFQRWLFPPSFFYFCRFFKAGEQEKPSKIDGCSFCN